jgi:hypothetical protein
VADERVLRLVVVVVGVEREEAEVGHGVLLRAWEYYERFPLDFQ